MFGREQRSAKEAQGSMNRIDRLTAIILLLQTGRRTASEIARRFEVSRRTVLRDIDALGQIGVPILAETGAHGGYTLMPDYSLAPLQLTARETLLLRLALSSVAQLADAPFKAERESLLVKIQALLPISSIKNMHSTSKIPSSFCRPFSSTSRAVPNLPVPGWLTRSGTACTAPLSECRRRLRQCPGAGSTRAAEPAGADLDGPVYP
jgi:biotin operon repressor